MSISVRRQGLRVSELIMRLTIWVLAAGVLLAVVPASATSNVAVGLCAAPGTHYPSIQAAVSAAQLLTPPAIVRVCPGTYSEQVTITAPLTLEGVPGSGASAGEDAVVITPPASGLTQSTTDQRGGVAAQIFVQGTTAVSISNLTVDGTGNQVPGGDDLRGILYQDASGTVNHVAVRNEVPNDTPTGVQSGQGIFVETTSSSSADLTVENSSVHNYNKNGIVARYAGATLTATSNYVQGSGPISYIAQNGIEIAFNGAGGSIKDNTVIDNFYIPTSSSASDILLFDAKEDGSATVSGNTVGNSNIAIALETDSPGILGDGVIVTSNKIFGTSTLDAIDLCTSSNIVTGNTIFNSAQSGIHLDSGCGAGTSNNKVTGNTILESACAGILVDSGSSGTTSPDTFFTVQFTVTSTTTSCTIPAALVRASRGLKFRP
jgi:hypothetical protein